jgi:hypothetical protein
MKSILKVNHAPRNSLKGKRHNAMENINLEELRELANPIIEYLSKAIVNPHWMITIDYNGIQVFGTRSSIQLNEKQLEMIYT